MLKRVFVESLGSSIGLVKAKAALLKNVQHARTGVHWEIHLSEAHACKLRQNLHFGWKGVQLTDIYFTQNQNYVTTLLLVTPIELGLIEINSASKLLRKVYNPPRKAFAT